MKLEYFKKDVLDYVNCNSSIELKSAAVGGDNYARTSIEDPRPGKLVSIPSSSFSFRTNLGDTDSNSNSNTDTAHPARYLSNSRNISSKSTHNQAQFQSQAPVHALATLLSISSVSTSTLYGAPASHAQPEPPNNSTNINKNLGQPSMTLLSISSVNTSISTSTL